VSWRISQWQHTPGRGFCPIRAADTATGVYIPRRAWPIRLSPVPSPVRAHKHTRTRTHTNTSPYVLYTNDNDLPPRREQYKFTRTHMCDGESNRIHIIYISYYIIRLVCRGGSHIIYVFVCVRVCVCVTPIWITSSLLPPVPYTYIIHTIICIIIIMYICTCAIEGYCVYRIVFIIIFIIITIVRGFVVCVYYNSDYTRSKHTHTHTLHEWEINKNRRVTAVVWCVLFSMLFPFRFVLVPGRVLLLLLLLLLTNTFFVSGMLGDRLCTAPGSI